MLINPLTTTTRRSITIAAAVLVMFGLSACHYVGHAPPGQMTKVVNPPPGHGGIPPGQLKKY
jgi:hypothetical protein